MKSKKMVFLVTSGLTAFGAACATNVEIGTDLGESQQALSPVPYAPPQALPPTLSDRQTWLESVGDVATMRKEYREDLRVLRDNPVIAHGYTLRKYQTPQNGDVYERFEAKIQSDGRYLTTRAKHALNLVVASDDPEFKLGSDKPSGSLGALFGPAPFVPKMATLPGEALDEAGTLQQLTFHGTRLGYTPAKLRVEHTDVNFAREGVEEFQARLDPNVLLVPVRVFVIVNKGDSTKMLETHSLSNQMRFWDGYSLDAKPVITYGASSATGPTLAMSQEFPTRAGRTVAVSTLGIDELKQEISKSYPRALSPDDVFGACGVQFRLVDYTVVEREPKYSYPLSKRDAKPEDPTYWADTTSDETPCSNNADYISKNYANPYSTLDMIVMSRVSFPTNKIIGLASTGTPACVKQTYDQKTESYALAHEIGHVSGLKHCSGKANTCRLMTTLAEDQVGPPSNSECTAVRAWAFNRAKSFPGFSATQP